MKNVLIIANKFPPTIGAGAIRPLKFAKFLPEFGWKPLVLTVSAPSAKLETSLNSVRVYRSPVPGLSPFFALGRRLFPKRVKNTSAPTFHSFTGRSRGITSWMLIPDDFITWVPLAVMMGLWIVRQHKVEAILSTSPDQSTHLIALILSKILHCRWVADFRDPWVTNPFFYYPTLVHRQLNSWLERLVVTHADRVVTVSKTWLNSFITRYPTLDSDKFRLIPNGYDPDDFPTYNDGVKQDSTIRMVHNGMFFYAGQDPFPFLKAVKILFEQDKLVDVEIYFVGVPVDKLQPILQNLEIAGIVKLVPLLPYQKSLEYVHNADILLLFSGPGPGVINAKTFEYLATFKPILALTPPKGALAELLSHTEVAKIVEPDSILSIASTLEKLIQQTRNGYKPAPNREFVQQFSRRHQTGLLAECLSIPLYPTLMEKS